MGWVARLRIGARLAVGFGLMLLLIAGLIGSSYFSLQRIGEQNHQLIEQELVKVSAVAVIDTATRANGLATTELLLVAPDQVPAVQARINANRTRIDEALQTLDRLVTRPEGLAALAQLREARIAYVASFVQVAPLVQAGQLEQARQLVREQTLPALARLQAPIDTLRQLQDQLAQAHGTSVTQGITSARNLLLVLGATARLLGCVASVVLARSIVHPLRSGVAVAHRIAAGDLTQPLNAQGADEVADLLRALATMQASLRELVAQVHQGVEQVGSASTQIASANTDLSGRTEAQASALEQSAASMEELTSAIALNADAAQQARTLAMNASTAAENGGDTVGSVVRIMRGIDASSQRIGEIIGVIDGIAFQTNILALNAAVEAARAGEQGRGFAVVASEVRALAGRSADAARQIKQLIAASMEQVHAGTDLADRAGSAMGEVVHEIKRVSQLVVDIANAMQEQSTGVGQVGEAIAQLDQTTQQNAALVEETAAASQSLDEQARHLVASVARFRLTAHPA
ncbi:MAG: methyl-accepting chemotaxis protein [Hydrogenophaga sp.]|uniref:methyl-accepting chemotaxis protein n=1 Tax=Hydrogenophaga sp. TaxID=1904254 RepID=UPI003D9BF31D